MKGTSLPKYKVNLNTLICSFKSITYKIFRKSILYKQELTGIVVPEWKRAHLRPLRNFKPDSFEPEIWEQARSHSTQVKFLHVALARA